MAQNTPVNYIIIDFTNTVVYALSPIMRLKYIQNFNNISEIQSFTYLYKMLSWCS